MDNPCIHAQVLKLSRITSTFVALLLLFIAATTWDSAVRYSLIGMAVGLLLANAELFVQMWRAWQAWRMRHVSISLSPGEWHVEDCIVAGVVSVPYGLPDHQPLRDLLSGSDPYLLPLSTQYYLILTKAGEVVYYPVPRQWFNGVTAHNKVVVHDDGTVEIPRSAGYGQYERVGAVEV